MYQLFALVGGVAHHVGKVLPLETHAEDVEVCIPLRQFLLYILYDGWGGGGREGKHGGMGHQLAYLGYLQVGRAEVVAPLRDAVGFIDRDEADAHVA